MQGSNTVDKAIEVLFQLHSRPRSQGVTAIGKALGIPKSSAHRLLTSLGRRGLVERDGRGGYRTGIGLVALGLGVLEREPVVAAGRPVLESEAERLGETVFLVVARGGRLLVLDKVEGRGFLRAAPSVGSEVPVHATATGKLFLAFDPEAVQLPRGRLEGYTDRTPRSHRQLARAVARARSQGFAENREEWIPGLSVVAAPILLEGRLHAVLALACPSARWETLGASTLGRRLRAAADRIADRIGGKAS